MSFDSIDDRVKCENGVAILTLGQDVGELVYEELEPPVAEIIDMLDEGLAKHVVVDFSGTDYFGSHVITFLLKLFTRAEIQGGQMALVSVSPHELKILKVMSLETYWPIFDSLDEAVESVRAEST